MKIHPDQIEGVQPEKVNRKNKVNVTHGQSFGDVLNQEVGEKAPSTQGTALIPPPIVNPMIATESLAPVKKVDVDSTALTGQVESLLDKFDSYAATLAEPEAGLKNAYGTLDAIANEVAALKTDQANLSPELKALVDELETITVTEQFKFNRGDYS